MTFEKLGYLVESMHCARRAGDDDYGTCASREELEESRQLFFNLLDAIGKEKKITRDDVQNLTPSTVLESKEVKTAANLLLEWLRKRMRKMHAIDCLGLPSLLKKYTEEG